MPETCRPVEDGWVGKLMVKRMWQGGEMKTLGYFCEVGHITLLEQKPV